MSVLARKTPVYTAKFKRADDGALDAAYKKAKPEKPAKKPEEKKADAKAEKAAPVKRAAAKVTKEEKTAPVRRAPAKTAKEEKAVPAKRAATKTEKPENAAPVRRASVKTAKPAPKAEKPAAKRAAAAKVIREAEEKEIAPSRRRQAAPMSRREARDQEKARVAARERKLALSRSGGFSVTLITLLTVAFDVLGLLLCAVRGETVDTQAFTIMGILVPAALATALLLPRALGLDALLMALLNFVCGVGVVILYTVAPERGMRQAMFYAAGLLGMLIIQQIVFRLRKWRFLTGLAMVLGIGALILPLVFGQWNYGAKNWVQLPVIGSFQPSEIVKLSLVLALAYSFSAHRTVWQMMPALIFAAACLVLLMLQRDLGTALIYYMTTLVMFYAACGNVPLTLLGLGGGVGAAVMGYNMFAHVKVRVAMWRNPWSDALDKGYQIIQALLAIGSGGLFGVGLGQGTPNKIPAYFNDFIFAVVCEQLGIVFGVCVIAVYALIIVRSVSVCLRSRRSFDLLLGCGVAAMLGIQTFMIVAGVIKMIPLTGVTMPFLSYGGSSLISCLAMMGIVHGIYARAQSELEDDILGVK